ncbi:hypothetical protein [Dongia sp.]|uniref:hypothetical protein n=1 Tax=Dongia sp. TaxID=1977262 RepID=UPI003751ACDF
MNPILRGATLAALLCAASLSGAKAEEAFYLGQWKITGAAPGPWIKSDAELFPDEMKSLVGQTITIKSDAIEGPGGFPCKGPKYEVMEGGPDMLFQGAFGEMQSQNAANDPQKLAEQVGFAGTQYRTVMTGCEFAVDFSFGEDKDTAMFALDNAVYTLKRQ